MSWKTAFCIFLVVFAALAGSVVMAGDAAPGIEEKGREASIDDIFKLYQPYAKNIYSYEPIYFLMGTDPEKSKFQLSLKYRPVQEGGSLVSKYPWTRGFHLAYTQTSFWNLSIDSKPFEDTSYKPEVFWISNAWAGKTEGGKNMWGFLQTGYQHESNGKGGEDSRSTNHLYMEPMFVAYDSSNSLGMMIAPRVWAYVENEDTSNRDLYRYRGHFELKTKFGMANSLVLGSTLRVAEKGVSVTADLTYPLSHYLVENFGIYLHLQYVNALAENMLNYKERTEALRIGFSLVR